MQKPTYESPFSKLLYEASLYTSSLHWLTFPIQEKVKVTVLSLAFFSTLFALNLILVGGGGGGGKNYLPKRKT